MNPSRIKVESCATPGRGISLTITIAPPTEEEVLAALEPLIGQPVNEETKAEAVRLLSELF